MLLQRFIAGTTGLIFLAGTMPIDALAQGKIVPVAPRVVVDHLKEPRLALVIGNSKYVRDPLINPVNDAKLVATTLRELNFTVADYYDLGVKDLRRVAREFALRASREDGVAIFYYAGHGMEINGRNFLLPVDIDVYDEEQIKDESMDLEETLMERLEKSKKRVNLIILDACRDNPFKRSKRGSGGGLAQMSAPRGTLIAYSTQPGRKAEDGNAANSTYTMQLTRHMKRPGLEAERALRDVAIDVSAATRQQQIPYQAGQLLSDFFFHPVDSKAEAERTEAGINARVQDELRKLEERAKMRESIAADDLRRLEQRLQAMTELEEKLKLALAAESLAREKADRELQQHLRGQDAPARQANVERAGPQQAERDRLNTDARDRLAQEAAERTRRAQEATERARIALEAAERARLAHEAAERGRLAQEADERRRLARDTVERNRLAKEVDEKKRMALETVEHERLASEARERGRLAEERRQPAVATLLGEQTAAREQAARASNTLKSPLQQLAALAVDRDKLLEETRKASQLALLREMPDRAALPERNQYVALRADNTFIVRGVKLPGDVQIRTPDRSVPPNCAAFTGAWGNARWDGTRAGEIWVEEVRLDCSATVVYANGGISVDNLPPGFRRVEARIRDRMLKLTWTAVTGRLVTVELVLDSGRLVGTWDDTQTRIRAEFEPISTSPNLQTGLFANETVVDNSAGFVRYISPSNLTLPLPKAVPGLPVLTTLELQALLRSDPRVVLIDAYQGKPHMSLPGSKWIPDIGGYNLGAAELSRVDQALKQTVERDYERPIVIFSRSANYVWGEKGVRRVNHGWDGYHAILRVLGAGYHNLYWYRGGFDAWFDAALPVQPSVPLQFAAN